MSVEYVPFHIKHLDRMNYIETPGSSVKDRMLSIMATPDHHMITVMRDKNPVVVLAGIMVWPGVMDVSALIDEASRRLSPITLHKSTKESIEICRESRKLHRMQMTVRADFTKGCRWAESLGFEREATLKHYEHDKVDAHVYRRLW